MASINRKDLLILDEFFKEGLLKVKATHYPMEQLAKAWELSMSGRAAGKIIVDVAH
jgi:D-arabinose 1-dehydrogenase-like Zn-dependent alcohol dehydrogenase